MGNDGGSIPDRRDLVKNKPKAEQADKANQIRALWFFCALSKVVLSKSQSSPVHLENYTTKMPSSSTLLDKSAYGDWRRDMRTHPLAEGDVRTLKLTPRSPPPSPGSDVAKFVCPLNLKEMNGAYPFVYINTCGCVFSQSGLKAVIGSTLPSKTLSNDESSAVDKNNFDVCPQCATKFSRSTDILPVNPSKEEEEQLCIAMEVRRSREPVKPKSKKRKANAEGAVEDNSAVAKKKKEATDTHSPSPAPAVNSAVSTASKALASSLIAEEAKRKANMSDAVKSLYRSKYDQPRKETFTTMGTFTRYA
ncbi:Rtf2 RING-finger-domain-containing protein [Pisolithus croceorrhizus]|nr:Rtf2 RING-finger-domain-containing protein [Pisolithus croceorrhizus]